MTSKRKIVLGCSLGECVHVAGVHNFLSLSDQTGYKTIFLGPAVAIESLIDVIRESNPAIVGVSYRLSPETGESIINTFIDSIREAGLTANCKYLFAGTPPVAKLARRTGFFDAVFSGLEPVEELLAILKGKQEREKYSIQYSQNLIDRINLRKPYPLIRHHFGLPTMAATIEGIKKISEAYVLDIISLGTDQDAQENFFHPEKIAQRRKGAGGVPVRNEDDFKRLYQASRCGNYPLMRTYAGTNDLLKQAEVHVRSINNCFAAIPLFWFNQLDGRGPMTVVESIEIHQKAIRWYGEQNIPVEINEPHHWSLRDAPDEIFVAMAYVSAYNAKQLGVNNYIAQFMFNTPSNMSFKMDLAKMLAVIEMIEGLKDDSFDIIKETRSGLLSYPVDMDASKGQLASSTMLQMAIEPEIVHVVAYCEADHAATPDDVISSCKIVRQVIENSVKGVPDMKSDTIVQKRKAELIGEAENLLDCINSLNSEKNNPLTNPGNLARALQLGVLDAPHLTKSEFAKGMIKTSVINGACKAIHPLSGKPLSSEERISLLGENIL